MTDQQGKDKEVLRDIRPIPVEYESDFDKDPDVAWRSFGDRPYGIEMPFFNDRQAIHDMVKPDYANPFDHDTCTFDVDWVCNDNYYRFIHCDYGHTHDACGLAMCHIEDFERYDIERPVNDGQKIISTDYRPVVKIDFLARMAPQEMAGEEVVFEAVRELIYEVSRRGFPVTLITFDRFNSIDSIQLLRQRGYIVANLSLDRCTKWPRIDMNVKPQRFKYEPVPTGKWASVAPYMTFRQYCNARRLIVPTYLPVSNTTINAGEDVEVNVDDLGNKMDAPAQITWIESEALNATHVTKPTPKVMESPHSTIDLLEAAVGCVFTAVRNTVHEEEYTEDELRQNAVNRMDNARTFFEERDAQEQADGLLKKSGKKVQKPNENRNIVSTNNFDDSILD